MSFQSTRTILLFTVFISFSVFISSCSKEDDDQTDDDIQIVEDGPGDSITDIEGNTYQTIWINGKNWMAENLKTTQFNDGTDITLEEDNSNWVSLSTEAYCWFDNDEAEHKEMYGALYNWFAVESDKLCPTGWRVPSENDWTNLFNYLAQNGFEETQGIALKASNGWQNEGNGTDNFGFKALPAGYRSSSVGGFLQTGRYGYLWSSTEENENRAFLIILKDTEDNAELVDDVKRRGASVRCVKEN